MGAYSKYYNELNMRRVFLQAMDLTAEKLRADRASNVKSEFLATVSHDLRTPLNGILGNLRLIRLKSPGGAQLRDKLDTVERSALAMRNLVDDVLDVTRIESGGGGVAHEAFDLAAVIGDIEATLSGLATDKGIDLVLPDCEPGAWWLTGDSGRLRQILLNVAGNAVKFTASGFVRLSVEASADGVVFEVADSGVGIPADQVGQVTDPFVQATNAPGTAYGGSGLGLSIVKRLVDSLNGRLTIVSQVDRGTTVRVFLPFARLEAGHAAIRGHDGEAAATVGRPLRLLVVEDDPTNMAILAELLRHDGHEVTPASSAGEALERFESGRFDCVLSDMRLPDATGMELAARLRADGGAGVPILAVTANVMPEDMDRYMQAGLAGVVAKPVHERDLFSRLRAATSGARAGASATPAALGGAALERVRALVPAEEYQAIVESFIASLAESRAALEDGIARRDARAIGQVAHRVSGAAASFGQDELAKLAAAVEAGAGAGPGQPVAMAPELAEAIGAAMARHRQKER